jgi:hypothetical protein
MQTIFWRIPEASRTDRDQCCNNLLTSGLTGFSLPKFSYEWQEQPSQEQLPKTAILQWPEGSFLKQIFALTGKVRT